MTAYRSHDPLPIGVRTVLWDRLWDKLLAPPRRELAEAERIPTPEEVADPEPRSRGEGGRP